MNENACATKKLAEGIRRFDTVKLENFLDENFNHRLRNYYSSFGNGTWRLPRRYATKSHNSSSFSVRTSPSGIIE